MNHDISVIRGFRMRRVVMFVALLCLVLTQANTDATPVNRPVLAGEKWYQERKEAEHEFEGKLDVNPGDGKIGLPKRYNAFRIIGIEDGKPVARLIYTEGKDQLLGPYVGQRVKLLGKVVTTESDEGKLVEFWPAQVLSVSGDATDAIGEIRVLARTQRWAPSRRTPQPQALVIRDAGTLAQHVGMGGGGADVVAEKSLCQILEPRPGAMGIQSIDWKKQMVVAISGGIRPSGGARVEVTRQVLQEKGLDIYWKLLTQPGGVGLSPTETMLVPRFDGEVRFFQEGVKQPIVVPAVGAPIAK
jgi:hypothetical protein